MKTGAAIETGLLNKNQGPQDRQRILFDQRPPLDRA